MNPPEINSERSPKVDGHPGGGPDRGGTNRGTNHSAGVAINALSRVLAVLVVGAAVAGMGALLDSWRGTNYWMLVGIVLGTLLAIPGLFLVAKVSELDAKRGSPLGPDYKAQQEDGLGDRNISKDE